MKQIMISYEVRIDEYSANRFALLNFTETADGYYNLKITPEALSDLIRIGVEQGLQIKECRNEN